MVISKQRKRITKQVRLRSDLYLWLRLAAVRNSMPISKLLDRIVEDFLKEGSDSVDKSSLEENGVENIDISRLFGLP